MPLSRVREFIGIGGGPTPRDAVLLKSLLVVHEGIAWAADRPHYRYTGMGTERCRGLSARCVAYLEPGAQRGFFTRRSRLGALLTCRVRGGFILS